MSAGYAFVSRINSEQQFNELLPSLHLLHLFQVASALTDVPGGLPYPLKVFLSAVPAAALQQLLRELYSYHLLQHDDFYA